MLCCAKNRKSNFCPDCGKAIESDSVKSSLVAYLNLQKHKLESQYERRLKINPAMPDFAKEKWLKNIEKWSVWLDWVMNSTNNTK